MSQALARGLVRRGHSVHVVTSRQPGFSALEEHEGIEIHRVWPGRGSRWQRMLTYIAGMLGATARLQAHADVIHVQQALFPAAAMSLASPIFRRPLVVTNHGSGPFGEVQVMRRELLGALGLQLIRRAATCVALSSEMRAEMRHAGFTRVVEIPNGVELTPLMSPLERSAARQPLGQAAQIVLYVGRLEAEKGVDLLIRAWQNVAVDGALLLIVGDGSQRAELERLAAENSSLAASIEFRGATADVQCYLQAADLFVLPSRSEGISIALLEAMASGLPVIATDVGGNRQVLSTLGVGQLVEPGNPQVLGLTISRLLTEPVLLQSMGTAARKHVASNYSVERMIDAYEQLYLRVRGVT